MFHGGRHKDERGAPAVSEQQLLADQHHQVHVLLPLMHLAQDYMSPLVHLLLQDQHPMTNYID